MGPFRPLMALATLFTVALPLVSCEAAGRAKVAPHVPTAEERTRYPWLTASAQVRSLEESFAPPEGYTRMPLEAGSFGAWLRGLPLRPDGTPVRDFQGQTVLAASDARLAAVGELDVGTVNLQQCADSILRLHAEWRWASGHPERIAYRFTSGHLASWPRYAAGERARVSGAKVTWVPGSAAADSSRAAFRNYLDLLFTYAGTLSIQAEGARPTREQLRPGDFFVLGGSPGHTVLVLDVASNTKGERVALVGQGFTPAQDFHVLAGRDGPWFSLEGDSVATPFWVPFPMTSLRRLPAP
ncbi:DUF4846 domain-containing protein [Corallococcus carmarthensis]|uniref:DUF4846 domain-containing protein n=1 Tax=Corallococcus carmarthensis TaxID=2316728 RepID=A0A3A8KBD1_9BACT|nr:DUF4846 domain-containing protein [Corallococcus carmarthensis]RKH05300.1 hypothetical protein D7X32_08375 [Corallococcus carmarthensis]